MPNTPDFIKPGSESKINSELKKIIFIEEPHISFRKSSIASKYSDMTASEKKIIKVVFKVPHYLMALISNGKGFSHTLHYNSSEYSALTPYDFVLKADPRKYIISMLSQSVKQ